MRSASILLAVAALAGGASSLLAQDALGVCARPDSVAVTGNTRITTEILLQDIDIARGRLLSARGLKRAEETLYNSGNYDEVQVTCLPPTGAGMGKTVIVFAVKERPLLRSFDVAGTENVAKSAVRDRISLELTRPTDPAAISYAIGKIDSVYRDAGYYLARVHVDTTVVDGHLDLTFRVVEGRRLAISGIEIIGNSAVKTDDIVSAMASKPEGFFWFQKGEFDDDRYAADIVQSIPRVYASRGFIDMQVVKDTVIVNPDLGKAYLRVTVVEGPQYRVGAFEVTGGKHFSAEYIAQFNPFVNRGRGLADVVSGAFRGRSAIEQPVFDQAQWEEATDNVKGAYDNDGYIYAQIVPVMERMRVGADSAPVVNLRWEVLERSPAIINRIDFTGNDFTSEQCVRDQLYIFPGDVFNRDRLMRSFQNIGNLGFFEAPMDPPKDSPANERGDINLTFHLKEKKTGAVNFGAQVGQGTGLGGFVGFEQPNLWGKCKRGSLQWQYGQYINDFNLNYSDPRIRGGRVSGMVTAYNTRSQFTLRDLGRSTRTGAQMRFGFPLPSSRSTRLYLDYGGERVAYGESGLTGSIQCRKCFRSTVGGSIEHDTRLGIPFPFAGVREIFTAQFNGGPLGGSSAFSRYTAEMKTASTLFRFSPFGPTGEPMLLTFQLGAKAGALFGDPGPFFISQAFSLGGTQYGESLRGYEEFSITPHGFQAEATQYSAERSSFGNAFFTTTAELGLRLSPQLSFNAFYDAGNLWARPRDFDPSRLYRGTGVGALIVTPMGPLGIDLGYGFDRLDIFGQKAPKWQTHFKFGQIF